MTEGIEGNTGDAPPMGGARRSFLLLRAGAVPLALPLERAREVVRAGRTVRIPGARSPVEGLLGVRGDVVAVVDLLRAIDPSVRDSTLGPVVVVQGDDTEAQSGGRVADPLGIRVTSVDDLFEGVAEEPDLSVGDDSGPSAGVESARTGAVDELTCGTVSWRNESAAILDPAALRRMAAARNGGSDVG